MRLTTVMVAGALAFAACGDEEKPAVSKAKAPAPVELDGAYVGSWFANLSGKRAAQLGDPRVAGKFRLELRADGTYTTFQELDGEIDGRYHAEAGDRLVFGKDAGCDEGGRGGTGVYGWSVRGGRLRLKILEGETGGCSGRTQSLTYPVWERR